MIRLDMYGNTGVGIAVAIAFIVSAALLVTHVCLRDDPPPKPSGKWWVRVFSLIGAVIGFTLASFVIQDSQWIGRFPVVKALIAFFIPAATAWIAVALYSVAALGATFYKVSSGPSKNSGGEGR